MRCGDYVWQWHWSELWDSCFEGVTKWTGLQDNWFLIPVLPVTWGASVSLCFRDLHFPQARRTCRYHWDPESFKWLFRVTPWAGVVPQDWNSVAQSCSWLQGLLWGEHCARNRGYKYKEPIPRTFVVCVDKYQQPSTLDCTSEACTKSQIVIVTTTIYQRLLHVCTRTLDAVF